VTLRWLTLSAEKLLSALTIEAAASTSTGDNPALDGETRK
jgi:hypothetical protein